MPPRCERVDCNEERNEQKAVPGLRWLSLGVDAVVEDLGMRAGMRDLEQDAVRGVRLAFHNGDTVVFAKVQVAAVLIVGELDTHRTTARHHFDTALVLQIAVNRICRDLGSQALGDRRQKIAMVHLARVAVEASDTHYANQSDGEPSYGECRARQR